ncbi:MAG: divergent PAP2 family protein [Nanoarchaeota archaeon]
MTTIVEILSSRLILSILLTIVITQLVKLLVDKINNGGWNFRIIGTDGGMPSAHSSLVSSLTTAIYFETGFSYYFVIALVFALIVMKDAAGMRRALQQHAKVLNRMLSAQKKRPDLKELLGHTPTQVVSGALIGIIITLFIYSV